MCPKTIVKKLCTRKLQHLLRPSPGTFVMIKGNFYKVSVKINSTFQTELFNLPTQPRILFTEIESPCRIYPESPPSVFTTTSENVEGKRCKNCQQDMNNLLLTSISPKSVGTSSALPLSSPYEYDSVVVRNVNAASSPVQSSLNILLAPSELWRWRICTFPTNCLQVTICTPHDGNIPILFFFLGFLS